MNRLVFWLNVFIDWLTGLVRNVMFSGSRLVKVPNHPNC